MANEATAWREEDIKYYLRRFLIPFNVSMAVATGVYMIAVVVVCVMSKGTDGKCWNLLLLPLAAVGLGAVLGLMYASFGKESERFGPAMLAINGALGGAAATDLIKPDSTIGKFFEEIGTACGMTKGGGIVFVIVAGFGAAGFLVIYFNKVLMVNFLQAVQNARIGGLENAKDKVNQSNPVTSLEPGAKPKAEADVIQAAQVLAAAPKADPKSDLDQVRAQAKSLYLLGQYRDAKRAYEQVVEQDPKDADALCYVGNCSILMDRPVEAIDPLERAAALPGAPAVVWKLLGYAYLFGAPGSMSDVERLGKSAAATSRYLETDPTDPGALLNLACAYGQQGPEKGVKEKLMPLLRTLKANPQAMARIRELMQPGQDFVLWAGDADFRTEVGL